MEKVHSSEILTRGIKSRFVEEKAATRGKSQVKDVAGKGGENIFSISIEMKEAPYCKQFSLRGSCLCFNKTSWINSI